MGVNVHEIRQKVQSKLSKARFHHVEGTVEKALDLAEKFKEDPYRIEVSGLLHDIARELPENEILELTFKHRILMSPEEKLEPSLLHAQIGSYIARDEFGIDDKDILRAIASHTFGRPNMTRLEEIIYIADFIEPSRKEEVRKPVEEILEQKGLAHAILLASEMSIRDVLDRKGMLHTSTIQTYNHYLNMLQ